MLKTRRHRTQTGARAGRRLTQRVHRAFNRRRARDRFEREQPRSDDSRPRQSPSIRLGARGVRSTRSHCVSLRPPAAAGGLRNLCLLLLKAYRSGCRPFRPLPPTRRSFGVSRSMPAVYVGPWPGTRRSNTLGRGRPLSAVTGTISAGAFSVFRAFGYGFLEPVYRRSLGVDLKRRGVRVEQEVKYELFHFGEPVGC